MKTSTAKSGGRRVSRTLLLSEFIVSRSATGIAVLALLLAVLASTAIVLAPSSATVIVIAHVVALATALVSGILLSNVAGDYSTANMLFYYMLPVSRSKIALSIILSYAVLPLLSLVLSLVIPVAVLAPDTLVEKGETLLVVGYTTLWTAMTIWIALMATSLKTSGGVVIALTLIYILAAPMVTSPFLAMFFMSQQSSAAMNQVLLLLIAIVLGLFSPGSPSFILLGPGLHTGLSDAVRQALPIDWAIMVALYYIAYRKLASVEV